MWKRVIKRRREGGKVARTDRARRREKQHHSYFYLAFSSPLGLDSKLTARQKWKVSAALLLSK